MAGIDTIKGITFQHLCAILKALEMLEDSDGEAIRIEGTRDVIDFEVFDSNEQLIYVAQAKSREEPYNWNQAKFAEIIKKWSDQRELAITIYEFLTDCQAAPNNEIPRILARLRESEQLRAEDIDKLKKMGMSTIPLQQLRRMYFRTRYGDKRTLHDKAILKAIRLLESTPKKTSYASAKAMVNNLFLEISMIGGDKSKKTRLLSREDLLRILELPIDTSRSQISWTKKQAQEYRDQVIKRFENPSIIELAATGHTASPPAVALLSERDLVPIDSDKHLRVAALLAEPHGAALCSPAGGGKTSTLRFLASKAARSACIPIYVEMNFYTPGSLERVLRISVEDTICFRGDSHLIEKMNSMEDRVVVLIDGITEIPLGERNALRQDLLDFKRSYPNALILVAGRELEGLRRFQLPRYRLQALDKEKRAQIIERHLNMSPMQAYQAGVILESSLGSIVNIPLFLVMALSLYQQEITPSTRLEIYDGFLEGICYRHRDEVDTHTLIGVLACACYDLARRERKKVSRHKWLEIFDEILEKKKAIFSKCSPESLVKALEQIGILERGSLSDYVGLLHDSFLDYFASSAISKGYRPLPADISPKWEDTIVFYVENLGIDVHLARNVLKDNLLLAIRLASLRTEKDDPIDLISLRDLIQVLFTIHLGDAVKEKLKIVDDPAGLILYYGDKRLYASLMIGEESQIMNNKEHYEEGLNRSIVTIATPRPCGSVRLITTIWYALTQHALESETHDYKTRKIPDNRQDLAKAIKRRFLERNKLLMKIAVAWTPSLAKRLTDRVGWTGLKGYILPARTESKSGKKKHRFSYKYITSGFDIELIEKLPDLKRWRPRTTTDAEDFLGSNPMTEILKHLREFIEHLRPRATYEVSRWET